MSFKSSQPLKNKMSNFPLYDNLSKGLPKKDLLVKQKNEFMTKVGKINDSGAELIYALIRVYQMENTTDTATFKLPFGGKYAKSDMKFDLTDLPVPLRHILYKFVNIHTKTMEEEAAMEQQRA